MLKALQERLARAETKRDRLEQRVNSGYGRESHLLHAEGFADGIAASLEIAKENLIAQWVNANDAKPPDMWTVIIYAVDDIQPEGYIDTGCYNYEKGHWHQCIRCAPEQGVSGTMTYEMFKDSMDEIHPKVIYWMDPRPPEGHTGNCND